MRASDFFIEEEDPAWDLKGLDPEHRMRAVLDTAFIDRLRTAPQAGVDDIEVTYGLAQLANEELEE
jgi:hypothetical protein